MTAAGGLGYLDEILSLLVELRHAAHETRVLMDADDRESAVARSRQASVAARRLHRHLVAFAVPTIEHSQELLRDARWKMRRGEVPDALAVLRRVEALLGGPPGMPRPPQ